MAARRGDRISSTAGIGLIAASTLTVIALASGGQGAPKFSSLIAGALTEYFGRIAWVLPILGFYWGWKLIVGKRLAFDLAVSALTLLCYLLLSTLHFVLAASTPVPNVGGRLGGGFAKLFNHIFGGVGGLIVLGALTLVVLVISDAIDLRQGALWLQARFMDLLLIFRDAFAESQTTPQAGKPRPRRRRQPAIVGPAISKDDEVQGTEEQRPLALGDEMPVQELKPAETGMDLTGEERAYKCPPLSLFKSPSDRYVVGQEELQQLADYLEAKLASFGIEASVTEIHPGPVITRFEVEPGTSTKVHQVVNLADDLALALKARNIRILAPIPGKGTIGIEVPNRLPSPVLIREVLASARFEQATSKLEIALGKDVAGNPYTADLEVMPHLLIAGATGSGKSVCINAIITSLVYRNSPQDVQLILIDPKRLELSQYEGIPHLLCEVVTEAKKAVKALNWVIEEMDTRYQILARRGVRNIQQYEEGLPYIVVIIDELADLMLMMPQEIETAVTKLAQMARAVGIHLVMATQRPSVDVITGVIKANFPCRIAFKVASKIDSRTIIDANGAERLLGKGDMLFVAPGAAEAIRLHGAFVSHEETRKLVDFLRKQSHLAAPSFSVETVEPRQRPVAERDELFEDAARIVITHGQGSVSLLQRRLKIGYSRAARLIDFLEEAGIVGPFEGSKARQVLVDETYLENLSGRH